MSADDRLSEEQYAVIMAAEEEATLADVMDEYRARQRWTQTGSHLTPSDLSDDAKRALVPRFAAVLSDMIARGWIDLWWGLPMPGAVKVAPAERDRVLNDPASWITDGDDWLVVGMTTTDVWDQSVVHRSRA